jgi:hypothetical protein
MPTHAELLETPERALELAPVEAATMLARVGALEAMLRARLAMPPGDRPDPADLGDGRGRWMTPEEAAPVAGVSRRVIYGWSRRTDWRGFTRRLSRKVLRIEERGFRRWLDRQSGK